MPVKLKVNNQEIEVVPGTLLIEAVKQVGVDVPHFCYSPKLKPDANCRMCLVEIEKMPKLQTSCSTQAAEGMVVLTDSPRVKEAQFSVMEFLLGNHPLDCPECDQGGECQLQDFAHKHSPTTSRFTEKKRTFEKEFFGPLIEKEMNRCVACMRCVRYCDEVMDVNALGAVDRGNVVQIGGFAHHDLDCEFCGGCIQICPVGALTSRLSMYTYRPWQVKKTETICNYCSDGCQLTLETIDDQVVRVSSAMGTGRNNGDLCARGYFGYGYVNHKERMSRPIVRQKNRAMEVTWEIAVEKAVSGLSAVRAQYGPQAIGGIISSHCTNEELYLFQKLMRQVIGTPHVDSSARYGYINAVRVMQEIFGTTRLIRYEEILQSDLIFSFSSEMAETHPITALKVKEAVKKNGAQLITVGAYNQQGDLYRSHLPKLAHPHLQVQPGTDGVAILGLMKAVVESSLQTTGRGAYFDRMKGHLLEIPFERIVAITGVPESLYREVAIRYAGAKRGILIFGRAILRGEEGYKNVRNLCNLAILAGQVMKPGAGILALAEEANELGAIEMGAVPEYLPGLMPAIPGGKTLVEMLDAAERGEIKALYVVGENPLRSLPQKQVSEAIKNLDILICQDLFHTETASMAHIILPAASFVEKEGRFTNHEGEVQRVRRAMDPLGNAKPDWEIFSMIANQMISRNSLAIAPFHYKSASEVWREVSLTMPSGWPKFSSNTMASQMAAYCECPPSTNTLHDPIVTPGRFHLQIGQTLFHSGKMSTYADGLQTLCPDDFLLIHPEDAEELKLAEGEKVTITSDVGSTVLPVKFSPKMARRTLFSSEHFGLMAKRLLPFSVDPVTQVPYGDRGFVILSRVETPVAEVAIYV